MRWWITLSWRWFLRFVFLGIVLPCFLVQHYWRIPTWDYLWNHYLWDPYIPFMLGLIVLLMISFVPFGTKQAGGELSK